MMGYSPWGNKESDTTEQLILLHNMKGRNITICTCRLYYLEYRES